MRSLAAAVAVFAAIAVPQAYTASNAVPPRPAGVGSGAISGYVVSDVGYSVEGDRIGTVSFDVSPSSASTVRVRLRPGGPWHACALSAGSAECATPGEDLAGATELAVTAF
ncbi:MAG TPA: hypothetical protein VNI55_08240 [Gaiellaceae bacterium]|nr:hypothetical protein [Gaiellaceae bacterium]